MDLRREYFVCYDSDAFQFLCGLLVLSIISQETWQLSVLTVNLPICWVIETSVVAEMAHSDDDTVSENYSDYEFVEDGIVVCALCDDGGQVVLCHGLCMRAFHATVEDGESSNCASLGLIDALLQKTFYCKNCQYNQHQCFAYGELGSSDKSSHPEVFCCANLDCGYFYHPHCVAHLFHPENSIAAEDLRRRIAAGEQFECSAHRCHVCKEVEVRSARESQFAVCHRCPRAFHRRCLPREITFEVDVDMERGIYQRAWEGLIPDCLLIYCL